MGLKFTYILQFETLNLKELKIMCEFENYLLHFGNVWGILYKAKI